MQQLRPCYIADKVMYLSDITIYNKPARAKDYMTFLYGLSMGAAKLWGDVNKGGMQPSGYFRDISFAATFQVVGTSQKLCPLHANGCKDTESIICRRLT